MLRNIKTVSTDDYDAAVAAVQRYVDGMKSGKSEQMAGTFFKESVMYGAGNEGLFGGSIGNLYHFVEKCGSAPQMKARIDVLDITPTTAVVRVDIENDATGTDYTDFHTLIKADGNWQVIVKVFHTYGA